MSAAFEEAVRIAELTIEKAQFGLPESRPDTRHRAYSLANSFAERESAINSKVVLGTSSHVQRFFAMSQSDLYLHYADKYVQLASRAPARDRLYLLEMAAKWRALAELDARRGRQRAPNAKEVKVLGDDATH